MLGILGILSTAGAHDRQGQRRRVAMNSTNPPPLFEADRRAPATQPDAGMPVNTMVSLVVGIWREVFSGWYAAGTRWS